MALKSIDDVDVGGFDDELSATEIAYLTKNFRNFLRNNNRRARDKNTAELRNFRKNDPTKVNNTDMILVLYCSILYDHCPLVFVFFVSRICIA